MSHLLLQPTFDHFSFIEGEATTYNTFRAEGFIHKNFYEEAPEKEYSSWKDLRDFFFQIIRGKRTPLGFKFILSLPPEDYSAFLEETEVSAFAPADIQGMYFNFKYDGTSLQCTTGISLNVFTMDKTLEKCWDTYVEKFFMEHEIDYELM